MTVDFPDTPPSKDSVLVVGADGVGRYLALDTFTRTGVQDPPVVSHPGSVPADAPTFGLDAFAWSGAWTDGDGERYTSTDGSATVKFTGGYLVLLGTKDAHHGQLSVSIAGKAASSMSVKADARQTRAVVFEATGLGDGVKTATISGTGVRTLAGGKAAGVQKPSTGGTTTPPTTTPTTPPVTPPATTNPAGWVTKHPDKPELLLDGKTYKFVGNNYVNAPYGSTNDTRRITDQADYFKRIAPGFVDRVWFVPGSPLAQLEETVAQAKANRSRLVVALFDALGSKGPKWDAIKSQWGSYRGHVETVVRRFKDDPTIIAWEVANEPPQDRAGFDLIGKAIRDIDARHLIGSGTVPAWSDGAISGYKSAGASPYIDILSIHSYDSLVQGITPHAARHYAVARELKKPIYWGEFGIDASPDGKGSAHTAPNNGLTSWAGRATLIAKQVDDALSKPEVCGAAYWSIGKNRLGGNPGDSYMPFDDTAGIGALQALARKWNRA